MPIGAARCCVRRYRTAASIPLQFLFCAPTPTGGKFQNSPARAFGLFPATNARCQRRDASGLTSRGNSKPSASTKERKACADPTDLRGKPLALDRRRDRLATLPRAIPSSPRLGAQHREQAQGTDGCLATPGPAGARICRSARELTPLRFDGISCKTSTPHARHSGCLENVSPQVRCRQMSDETAPLPRRTDKPASGR